MAACSPGTSRTLSGHRCPAPAVTLTVWLVGAALLASPALLRSQTRHQSVAPGVSVTGTLYLVSQQGAHVRAAGRTIALLADSDALRAGLDEVCRSHQRQSRAAEDSLERVRKQVAAATIDPTDDPWTLYWEHEVDIRESKIEARETLLSRSSAQVGQLLGAALVDSTHSGPDASFRLTAPQPGRYIVFGEWLTDHVAYRWWRPIDLPADASINHLLAATAAALGKPFCGLPIAPG